MLYITNNKQIFQDCQAGEKTKSLGGIDTAKNSEFTYLGILGYYNSI